MGRVLPELAESPGINAQNCTNWVRGLRLVIPALGRCKQEGQNFKVVLDYEYRAIVGYMKTCLRNKEKGVSSAFHLSTQAESDTRQVLWLVLGELMDLNK